MLLGQFTQCQQYSGAVVCFDRWLVHRRFILPNSHGRSLGPLYCFPTLQSDPQFHILDIFTRLEPHGLRLNFLTTPYTMPSFDMGSRFSQLANVSSPPQTLSRKADHSNLAVPLRAPTTSNNDNSKMTVPANPDYDSDTSSDQEMKRKRRERAKAAKAVMLGGDEEVWDETKVAAKQVKVTSATAVMLKPSKGKEKVKEGEKEEDEGWVTATGKKGAKGVLKEENGKPVPLSENDKSHKWNAVAAEVELTVL